jgi:hypothetical protein
VRRRLPLPPARAPAAGQASGKISQGPELEPLVWALRNLGHRAEAAQERVHEAAEHFQSLGQVPKVEQILKRALMRRDLMEKMDAREAATTMAATAWGRLPRAEA